MERRELEYEDHKSDKFWTIELDGAQHTVHYGRSGTAGQRRTKEFASEAAARKDFDKLVASKLRKGPFRVLSRQAMGLRPSRFSGSAASMWYQRPLALVGADLAVDVVISYHTADLAVAREVRQACLDEDLRVFLSHTDGEEGRRWDHEFFPALNDTTVTLALCGPHGVGPVQEQEIIEAAKRLKVGPPWFRLIPVLLPSAPPELPEELRDLNQITLGREPAGGLKQIAAAVRRARQERQRNPAGIVADQPTVIPDWRTAAFGEPADPPSLSDDALDFVRALNHSLVFMVGAWHARGEGPQPAEEVANTLLSELGLPAVRDRHLVRPSIASAWHGYGNARAATAERLGRALDRFVHESAEIDRLVARLVDPRVCRVFEEAARPVVVTARADLALETALVERGLPFVRLVYGTANECVIDGVHDIHSVANGWEVRFVTEGGPTPAARLPTHSVHIGEGLRSTFARHHVRARSLAMPVAGQYDPLNSGNQLILVKLMGCEIRPATRACSVVQLNALAASVAATDLVPPVVRATFNNSDVVFLGFNAVDPELMLMRRLFLEQRSGTGFRQVFVMPPSDRERFGALWPVERRARRDLPGSCVQCDPTAFLSALAARRRL